METTFIIITIEITNNNIPIITDKKELVLCLTTSVEFSKSNLGYFKLIIKPIKCETRGINIDNINNNIIEIILILNLINNIISPIINTGVVINKQDNILDVKMVLVSIGRDLSILIFFPSKLIKEFVIDVIKDVNEIIINIKIDVLFVIKSNDISDSLILFNKKIKLSYLKTIIMQATINNTKPNPALIINTGVEKNVFNSFFIKER